MQGGLEPDLTILLDAPAETGMARAASRGAGDRMDNEELAFYQRVRQGYLALARANPERFVIVDASQPLVEVQASIAAQLDRFINDNSL